MRPAETHRFGGTNWLDACKTVRLSFPNWVLTESKKKNHNARALSRHPVLA